MPTDDERRYTMENPHPADEGLSAELKEYIYGDPENLPELDWPDEDELDPFIHGGRIGAEDDK